MDERSTSGRSERRAYSNINRKWSRSDAIEPVQADPEYEERKGEGIRRRTPKGNYSVEEEEATVLVFGIRSQESGRWQRKDDETTDAIRARR